MNITNTSYTNETSEMRQVQIHRTPSSWPPGRPLRILVASCYYARREARAGVVNELARRLGPLRPDLTLMLGDQVYLDLPPFSRLPEDPRDLARRFEDDYRRSWFTGAHQRSGIADLLSLAPTIFSADDHEFWNNYPMSGAYMPRTWGAERLEEWRDVAQILCQRFQGAVGRSPTKAVRVDLHPLHLFVADSRTYRGHPASGVLFSGDTRADLDRWASDVATERGLAVFATGQSVLDERGSKLARRWVDATLADYRRDPTDPAAAAGTEDYQRIFDALDRIARAGVPILLLTGDVHYGRVAHGRWRRSTVSEVISSPLALVETPVVDVSNTFAGFFTRADYPRHSDASAPAVVPFADGRLEADLLYPRRGDHFCILELTHDGSMVSVRPVFHPIHADRSKQAPARVDPLTLAWEK
jgi:hypothetical protein